MSKNSVFKKKLKLSVKVKKFLFDEKYFDEMWTIINYPKFQKKKNFCLKCKC